VVKAHVARLGSSGAKAAARHAAYIERDGVERDGSPGKLYGADGRVERAALEEPRLGEKHQIRLIVSPEDAHDLDLTSYVRRYMARVERDNGFKLEWAAVNHFDTGHPHAHIVIRGVDLEGRQVRFDREYVSNGLRGRAQELATEELGPRPEIDRVRQRQREVEQDRFTTLDRDIAKRAVDNRFELRPSRDGRISANDSVLIGRLKHLEGLGLAEKVSATRWELTPSWQGELRELGMRGDIIKQMHRALNADPARYRILQPGQPLAVEEGRPMTVVGRVVRKGLSDELRGSFYAIVETPTGGGYHVPLTQRGADDIREGDVVALSAELRQSRRPIDGDIERVAAANGGVYAIPSSGSPVRDGHEKRLHELGKLGFVTPLGEGKWSVKPNLVEALDAKDRTEPHHQLRVQRAPLRLEEQIRHPGPVWLDRVDPRGLALYGFGSEVRAAVAKRAEVRRAHGIDPADPRKLEAIRQLEQRTAVRDVGADERKVLAVQRPDASPAPAADAPKLEAVREQERRALGIHLAKSTNVAFLETMPASFHGWVQMRQTPGSKRAYAEVTDGGRFVLVPMTPQLEKLIGRKVTLSRDPRGQLLVRGPDHDRERS
jgi:type IV secretory pathway VirD2 relaxase